MNMIGSKVLETDRLILRPSSMAEQQKLYEILMMPEVNKWYLTSSKKNQNNPSYWTWENQKKYYEKKIEHALDNDTFCWSIFLKENNEVIGQISCQKLADDLRIRDVGWFISPKYQRKGYLKEASKKMLDYMFNEVGISAISSSCVKDNSGSSKTFLNLGFTKYKEETQLSPYTFYDGELVFSFFRLDNVKVKEVFFNEDNLTREEIDESVIRVKAIILNDNDEITLGHLYNSYQFPGGHLEENECFDKTLERELKEELGINIDLKGIEPFFRVRYYSKNYRNKNINRENIIYYFKVSTNLIPDLNNTNYTDNEINGNYTIETFKYDLLDSKLNDSIDIDPINKVIVKEMKSAINEYNKLYRR